MIVPPLAVQVTAVFDAPVTVAENCCVPPGDRLAVNGTTASPSLLTLDERAGTLAGSQPVEIPAAARNYWAFTLPVQAPVPAASGHFQNPIDRFLEQVREEKGLRPAAR